MKKVDIPCFLLALSLSCLLLLFLSYQPTSFEAEQLKIGLVSMENNNTLESDGRAKTDASPKQEEQGKEKQEEKQEEKIPEEKLSEVEKTEEKVEIGEVKRPNLEELKKAIAKPKLDKQDISMNKFDKKNTTNSGIGIDVDKILSKSTGQKGLPSGSRMGVVDGTALIHWDPSNQEPIFPEIAKQTGKNGSVVLIVTVNETGDVISVRMERGSGVPEINEAIEKVARTWKVQLVKKEKSVGGSFVLKYSFHLE